VLLHVRRRVLGFVQQLATLVELGPHRREQGLQTTGACLCLMSGLSLHAPQDENTFQVPE
jgi:hypothetical protein